MSQEFTPRAWRAINPDVLMDTLCRLPPTTAKQAHEIAALLRDTTRDRDIVIEGPPIYVGQGHKDLPRDCRWDSPAFQGGWQFTDAVASALLTNHPSARLYHHAFMDDVNFTPHGGITRHDLRALAHLRRGGGLLRHHTVRRWETEFQYLPTDTCAVMDARFQLEKYASHGTDTVNVVVHPESFGSQQRAMLEQILGLMKHDTRFNHLQRKSRVPLLQDSYTHVWIGSGGVPTRITRPVFDGNKFQHEPIQ